MTKPVQREERLQRAVVQHLLLCLPANVVFFAVPNGGKRSKATAARLQLQGVKAGVADLTFVLPGGIAAFIELKVEKSYEGPRTYLSREQKAFRETIREAGGYFSLCRSVDEVMDVLEYWGVSLRGRARVAPIRNDQRATNNRVAA